MRMAGFRQYSKALFSFALAVCLLLGTCLTAAGAKEKRTVRVAFFPMEGYHEKLSDGRYAGMDAEYLDSLCGYANWQIRFVECVSWDEALRLLSARKVDLVGTAQYSPERAENFQYADLSSGYTFGIIAAGSDSPLAYEDFQAMENITFGMVKTYVRRDEFLQYMQDNGVSAPRIREYDSTRDLQQALDSGEIDAMVHTFMEIRDGQRLVGRFAPRPFYYISYATSALTAIDLWLTAQGDWEGAVEAYMALLAMDSEVSYTSALSRVGLRSIFRSETVSALAQELTDALEGNYTPTVSLKPTKTVEKERSNRSDALMTTILPTLLSTILWAWLITRFVRRRLKKAVANAGDLSHPAKRPVATSQRRTPDFSSKKAKKGPAGDDPWSQDRKTGSWDPTKDPWE